MSTSAPVALSNNALSHNINRLNRLICVTISFACLFMVLITFLIVVLRYGFNTGWIAMQESVMYLHAVVFMLSLGYTLQKDEHVRVDVFYRNFSARQKAWVNIVGNLALLAPTCIVILIYSIPYVSESWRLMESSMEAGGLPLVFVLKTLIPVGASLLLLQGLSDSLVCLQYTKRGR